MRISRRAMIVGGAVAATAAVWKGSGMSLSLEGWTARRQTLAATKVKLQSAVDGVDAAIAGFQRTPFSPSIQQGCVHNGYAYLTAGWEHSNIYNDVWRTKDFVVCEKAVGANDLPGICFHHMDSFAGKVYRGPGFDSMTEQGDRVTNRCFASVDGSLPWTELTIPWAPRECAGFMAAGDYLYCFLGLAYNLPAAGYTMLPDAWRMDANGVWEQRSADLPLRRRSFTYANWQGNVVLIGGRDDMTPGGPTNYNDIWRSTDGMQGMTRILEHGPFPNGYEWRAVVFQGRLVLLGGTASGAAGDRFATVYSSNDPDLQTWVQHPNMPVGRSHFTAAVLTVNGVETLGVITGYGSSGAMRDIYTTTDLVTWTARTDSDFWV
jgi:hypothetical protein